MRGRKLLFLATEDWFVRSHFMPMLRRAQADGFDVIVAARSSGADLEGVRCIDLPLERRSISPMALLRGARAVRALIDEERPDIVHAIALKPIVMTLCAGGSGARAYAVTGRGYLAIAARAWTRIAQWCVARLLRSAVAKPHAVLLVENIADRRWVEGGAPLPESQVVLLPGAGVDPAQLETHAEPEGPVIVGIASRLVRSKGVDCAVEAIQHLRNAGVKISLRIAGTADPENPEHVPDETLEAWGRMPGVALVGRVCDISAFWAGVHIACLPSRGGEGLPRTLLEASACARPIVTTDAPGCADFVVPGETGLVVPRGDVVALAAALRRLCKDSALRGRMGLAGRSRVVGGYTEQHCAEQAASAWERLLAAPHWCG